MNLTVTDSGARVRPDQLPPLRRDGPARVLFLSIDALGWKTSGRQLIAATQDRADIQAVHLLVPPPLWMKVLNRRVPGVRHHFIPPNRTWKWLLMRWLTGPVDAGRFDVVHCNPQPSAFAPAALKARYGFRLSMACDATDVQFQRDLDGRSGALSRDEGPIYAAADSIASLSTWCSGSLIDDYGVDPATILLTLPNSTVPAEPPARPGDGLLRIAFVGNDFARKGGPRLLDWHQRRWTNRGVELHVASAEAAGFPPAKNVTWHGRLDHDRVIALLATADLLVHPTTSDMSALVVAEAASLGVPAVASRLAGITDLVRDGDTGYLVDPADDAGFIAAVEKILFDPAARKRMSVASRAFARAELDTPVVYGRLLDRLVALADAGGRPV